jgi:hypothetical protein
MPLGGFHRLGIKNAGVGLDGKLFVNFVVYIAGYSLHLNEELLILPPSFPFQGYFLY